MITTGCRLGVFLCGCLALVIAHADTTTVYRCIGARGRIIFQDRPCAPGQRQNVLDVHTAPATASAPPLPAPPASSPEATSKPARPAPANQRPSTPLPRLYACVGATDGENYISHQGRPRPYLVPFGILGTVHPLDQVYGGPNGAGISAPEFNRGRITPGMVANNFVWVRDRCRLLDREQTCTELRDELDANEHALRQAFKSDQPPLEKREATLRKQLDNC